MSSKNSKIEVENINVAGRTNWVNAEKYQSTKEAYLKLLPSYSPGLTQKDVIQRIAALLAETLFPGGATAGWWVKTVQLDLEVKGVVKRENTRPLRWYKSH